MAEKTIVYQKSNYPFTSCEDPRKNLEVGEQIKIVLEPKNPDWPECVVTDVICVEPTEDKTSWLYTVTFDDDVLNGAPMFEGCDINEIRPFCCCDVLEASTNARFEEVETSIETLETTVGGLETTVGGLETTVGGLETSVTNIEGEIITINNTLGLTPPDTNTTYTFALNGNDLEITNNDTNVTQTLTLPSGNGTPTTGTFTPDASGVIMIPLVDSTGATVGIVNIDVSSIEDNTIAGFNLNTAGDFEIVTSDGTTFTAPSTDVDTSVVGEVTITAPNGDQVTISTSDAGAISLLNGVLTHTSSNGASSSVTLPFIPTTDAFTHVSQPTYRTRKQGNVLEMWLRLTSTTDSDELFMLPEVFDSIPWAANATVVNPIGKVGYATVTGLTTNSITINRSDATDNNVSLYIVAYIIGEQN